MTKETFEKAKQLDSDIFKLKEQLNSEDLNTVWIDIATPGTEEMNLYSNRFQHELIEWMKNKLKEYQKEFDEV